MGWYVSRNGETVGPVDDAQLVAWIQGGMTDAHIQPDTGGPWAHVMQTGFARFAPSAPKKRRARWQVAAAVAGVIVTLLVCGGLSRIGQPGRSAPRDEPPSVPPDSERVTRTLPVELRENGNPFIRIWPLTGGAHILERRGTDIEVLERRPMLNGMKPLTGMPEFCDAPFGENCMGRIRVLEGERKGQVFLTPRAHWSRRPE